MHFIIHNYALYYFIIMHFVIYNYVPYYTYYYVLSYTWFNMFKMYLYDLYSSRCHSNPVPEKLTQFLAIHVMNIDIIQVCYSWYIRIIIFKFNSALTLNLLANSLQSYFLLPRLIQNLLQ